MAAKKVVNQDGQEDIISKPPVIFRRDDLIKSRVFKGYQQDFLRALLPNEYYEMQEARRIVNNYYQGKKEV